MISLESNKYIIKGEKKEKNGNTLSPLARFIARKGLSTLNTRSVLIEPIVLPPLQEQTKKHSQLDFQTTSYN